MDKNAIKKYAIWARRELISRVTQRALKYGISENEIIPAKETSIHGVALSPAEIAQRTALISQISNKGFGQVMEEVAYTWFNRFSALRFMEVNGYLPTHVRVFTDDENDFKPQIMAEAINLEMDGLDMEKVYCLKDANDNDALFKYLIIIQCNALSSILPGMFQKIDDYTELLFPDNLLREGSAIEQMISLIPEDDWKDQVQIIGWLYQYYNTEPKDKVFAELKKNIKISKENIPAATQLFTPDWIVRYMVENSLGRLWLEGHPNTADQLLPTKEEQEKYIAGDRNEDDHKWHYYLEEAEQEPDVQVQLDEIRKEYASLKPEDIKCIDPCSGSGHILAYMYDVLVWIYETYGYTAREAAASIVENNLYGLDIDDRAAQLAYFSVMMKARQYDRRFFSRGIQPHVFAIKESNHIDKGALAEFVGGNDVLKSAMETIMDELQDAKEYGSIISVSPVDFKALYNRFDEIREGVFFFKEIILNDVLPLVQVAEALAQKYHTVVTNPPYMKEDTIPAKLHELVFGKWSYAKYDLYSAFMCRSYEMLLQNGMLGMITMHNFMFSPSFIELRRVFWNHDWTSMIHLGSRAFSEISGEVVQTTTYTIAKTSVRRNFIVQDVTDSKDAEEKENLILDKKAFSYRFNLKNTEVIPWNALGYALSEKVLNYYRQNLTLENHCEAKAGVVTGNDDFFCKLWYEVPFGEITFLPQHGVLYKYVPFSRGGTFVSWYGNTHHVLRARDMWNDQLTNKSVRRGDLDYYYKRGIGWSQMGGGVNKAYSVIENSVCKTTTPMLYPDEKLFNFILGYLNSPIPTKILKSLNPTLSILISDILHLPYVSECVEMDDIIIKVDDCIRQAKLDDGCYEISWNFLRHPLVRSASTVAETYAVWQCECDDRFNQLKSNEEELNRIFIDIYGLQDELTPEVEEKDVTVRKAELQRDIKSLISYAVGCMFGRYSLDRDGLIFAGGEWDNENYKSFPANKDNIIPISDDEYFEDDIVNRFVDFIRTVYGESTLNENLKFIADALGGKGHPKEVIRNYFLNDLYTDHLKTYQKRPIYWLFDSGKKNGFKCLIYMHRYQPDTIARIRTDYVHEQQSRYRTSIADLEKRIASASTGEKVKLSKQLSKIQDQAAELHEYEEKIHHLADQYISIDLDDGVKVNYAKFQDVLAKIK